MSLSVNTREVNPPTGLTPSVLLDAASANRQLSLIAATGEHSWHSFNALQQHFSLKLFFFFFCFSVKNAEESLTHSRGFPLSFGI